MTLNSTIIEAAYRESNFVGQASDLTAKEQNEGLALLQSLVDSFHGSVVGQKFKPWMIPTPNNTAPESVRFPAAPGHPAPINEKDIKYPPIQSRVILRTSTAQTLYFQYAPPDGAIMQIVDAGFTADVTLDANGAFMGESGTDRTETLTPQFPTGRVPTKTYVYRGDIASWVPITTLVYTGENPYPSEFDDFWITSLAMRLSPRFGNEPRQVTVMRYQEMLVFIRGWYRQMQEAVFAGPERADQAYYASGFAGDPDQGRI